MDKTHYNTMSVERKRGKHLTIENRALIEYLRKKGYSLRYIARELNCSPTTISNEVKRGTPPRKSNRGRKPSYRASYAQKDYQSKRKRSGRKSKLSQCKHFLSWMVTQVREHKWSLDACVGYARKHSLFPQSEIPCTKTLYHALWSGKLSLTVFDCPSVLKRKKKRINYRKHKR